jgi:hypothetical protein
LIHGVQIAPSAPEISLLLFADDSLLFCRATTIEVSAMASIIQAYQSASGQLVNLNKSEMVFSKGVPNSVKNDIHQIMPIQHVTHFTKYLGLPTVVGRSKKQVFNYIQDRIWKKLKWWKERHLSFAGRSTLIKAVAQAIPTYVMSSFLIPKGVCDQMEKMICRFWWGSTMDRRRMHWISWKKLCNHKKKGGIGFKNLRAFNEALLAKQGWRLITHPDSLVAQVLKAKYYPKDTFFNAKPKQQMSYTWRSILQARWVLKKGCYLTIGNGEHTDIWNDNWIHQHGNSSTWSKRPENTPYNRVCELMDNSNNGWNVQLIKQNFYSL